MNDPEFLPIDEHGEIGKESQVVGDPDAETLPLTDRQPEELDRRLDTYARDRNPRRLASIMADEIRCRRGPLGSGRLFETCPTDDVLRAPKNWVICLDNSGYEASLERQMIYAAIPDAEAERTGQMRIIDETGEDYLYPEKDFAPIRGVRAP